MASSGGGSVVRSGWLGLLGHRLAGEPLESYVALCVVDRRPFGLPTCCFASTIALLWVCRCNGAALRAPLRVWKPAVR
jgi:hypothetical protein